MNYNPLQIQRLSIDNQIDILSRLDPGDLLRSCQVNKEWSSLCRNERIWKELTIKEFGNINLTTTWYETYKSIYNKYQQFISELISKYLTVDPIYLNMKKVRNDIYKTLINFIKTYNNKEFINFESLIGYDYIEKGYVFDAGGNYRMERDVKLYPASIMIDKIQYLLRPVTQEFFGGDEYAGVELSLHNEEIEKFVVKFLLEEIGISKDLLSPIFINKTPDKIP